MYKQKRPACCYTPGALVAFAAQLENLVILSRRQRSLCAFDQLCKGIGILYGNFRKNPPIQGNVRFSQAADEPAVGNIIAARRGAQPDDKQSPEIALFRAPVTVGKLQRPVHGFLGGPVQFAFSQAKTFCQPQDLFSALDALASSFYSWHFFPLQYRNQILSIRLTRVVSDLLTSAVSTSLRTRLRGFLVKMWRAWLCRRVILPVPVNLNRFAALFLVLFTIPPRYKNTIRTKPFIIHQNTGVVKS